MDNNKKLVFLKWSNGTENLQSKRNINNHNNDNNVINDALQENNNEQIHHIDLETMPNYVPDGFTKQSNKREGQNEQLSMRGFMIQKSINPFLDSSKYLQHLDAEDNFLRPRDSNLGS